MNRICDDVKYTVSDSDTIGCTFMVKITNQSNLTFDEVWKRIADQFEKRNVQYLSVHLIDGFVRVAGSNIPQKRKSPESVYREPGDVTDVQPT